MNPYFVIYFSDSWIPAYRQASECLFFQKTPAIAPVLISVGWPPFDANRNPAKEFSQGSLAESSNPELLFPECFLDFGDQHPVKQELHGTG